MSFKDWEDRYRRVTAGKLPEAHLAFHDEVSIASSAILNTLLRILNERVFDNGDGTPASVPLLLCVRASNECPTAQVGENSRRCSTGSCSAGGVRPKVSAPGGQRLPWGGDQAGRGAPSAARIPFLGCADSRGMR